MVERLPSVADVRPIADVIADCQKVFISRLPGNKFVHAGWAAFCEAWEEYDFADKIIQQETASDTFLWIQHGRHQMAASVIRKIADGLGVPNMKPESEWSGPPVQGQEPGRSAGSGGEDQPG